MACRMRATDKRNISYEDICEYDTQANVAERSMKSKRGYLSIDLSTYLPANQSINQSIVLLICLSICILCVSIDLSINLYTVCVYLYTD